MKCQFLFGLFFLVKLTGGLGYWSDCISISKCHLCVANKECLFISTTDDKFTCVDRRGLGHFKIKWTVSSPKKCKSYERGTTVSPFVHGSTVQDIKSEIPEVISTPSNLIPEHSSHTPTTDNPGTTTASPHSSFLTEISTETFLPIFPDDTYSQDGRKQFPLSSTTRPISNSNTKPACTNELRENIRMDRALCRAVEMIGKYNRKHPGNSTLVEWNKQNPMFGKQDTCAFLFKQRKACKGPPCHD